MNNIKKLICLITLGFALLVFASLTTPVKVEAQEEDEYSLSCVGSALVEYIDVLTQATGVLSNIRLLSPAFNMTNPIGASIANWMTESDPNWINNVYGLAGNAYNCCAWTETPSGRITEHVETFRDLTGISLPVLLTETGVFDLGIGELQEELGIIQGSSSDSGPYLGAVLFNAFKTGSSEWDRFGFDNDGVIKDKVCNDPWGCQWIGVNSAGFYQQSDGFYDRAKNLGMTYTVEISNADWNNGDGATEKGVILALNRDLTPVIRVGTADSPGPDAILYGEYLANLDAFLEEKYPGRIVYAIAGPNEPQSECWAAPECGCDLSPFGAGNVRHPVSEGFYIGQYACNETANPEFHPLRPYPANACDPLIPRSDPEAPTLALNKVGGLFQEDLADYKKYNTFACGNNMVFSHQEEFDPYGIDDIYEKNDLEGIVVDSFGNKYLHTYCEDPGNERFSEGRYDQVCYRTVGYTVYTDFSRSQVGVLGNTQTINLTEKQKVNNYLSWYFTGTTQIGDRELLDPEEPGDLDQLINYSGPIRKLLPRDAVEAIRAVLLNAVENETGDIHDYALNNQYTIRMSTLTNEMVEFFPNLPNSSLEDIAGEAFFSGTAPGVGAKGPEATAGDPEPFTTAPNNFTITCAVGAQETCPAGGAGRIVDPDEPYGGQGTGKILPCIGNCLPIGSDCGFSYAGACSEGTFCCADPII